MKRLKICLLGPQKEAGSSEPVHHFSGAYVVDDKYQGFGGISWISWEIGFPHFFVSHLSISGYKKDVYLQLEDDIPG